MTGKVAPERHRPSGEEHTHRGRWQVLVAFWTVLALVCAAGVELAIVREEDPPPPSCPPTRQCGGPPPLIPSAALRTWESTDLGFQFEYSPALFRIEEEGDDSVRLRMRASRTDDVDAEVWVTGARV